MTNSSIILPNRQFTYAFNGEEYGYYSRRSIWNFQCLYLVFNQALCARDARSLLLLPELNKFFPQHRFGLKWAIKDRIGYAITDNIALLAKAMVDGNRQKVLEVVQGTPQYIIPYDVQDRCTLPHKHILGCEECLEEEGEPELHCDIKRKLLAQKAQRVSHEVLNELNQLRNLKDTVWDFVFISPSYLTSQTVAAPRRIDVRRIDFRFAASNMEARKENIQKRKQTKRFEVEVCSACLVRPCCTASAKYCSGAYTETENTYYETVLKNSVIPFNNAQISYLLYHSGVLPDKIKRNSYYLTFKYVDGLQFVVGNLRTGEEFPLSYKAAKKFIEKHGSAAGNTRPVPKIRITKKLKALLVMLSSLRHSPTRRSGWRKTSYPARYIDYCEMTNELKQYYWFSSGRSVASWPLSVESLHDIYRAHAHLPRVTRTPSNLAIQRNRYY